MISSNKVIVLDFDGVILESADIKSRAFWVLFEAYPRHLDAILDYHLKNVGVSRFRKFEHIFNAILRQPLATDELAALGGRFAELVWAEILKAPFVSGAVAFLETFAARRGLYVASGTPEDELRRIVGVRRITPYFVDTYGAPPTKVEILRKVLGREGISPDEALLVGDGLTDYEAAAEVGVPFIGRVKDTAVENPFEGLDVPLVADLAELSDLIDQIDSRLGWDRQPGAALQPGALRVPYEPRDHR